MEKIMVCSNPKNYKLTKDKEYKIDSETETYLFVENDNNKISKYHKLLFKKKEISLLTLDQLMDKFTITKEFDCYCFIYGDDIYKQSLCFAKSDASCGLLEFENINELSLMLKDIIFLENTNVKTYELLETILTTHILTNIESTQYLFSTNKTNNFLFEDIEIALDNITDIYLEKLNGNSDNIIKTWLI